MSTVRVYRSEAIQLTVDFTRWTPDAVVKAHGEDPDKRHEVINPSGVFQARAWQYEGEALTGKRVMRLRLFAFSDQLVPVAQAAELLSAEHYVFASPQLVEAFRLRFPASAVAEPHTIMFLGGQWQRVQFKKHDYAEGGSHIGPYLVREIIGLRACGPYYGLEAIAFPEHVSQYHWVAGIY